MSSGIRKVVLTGGREVGGLTAYACALADGFEELGYRAEVIPPGGIFRRWRELRDPRVLKILSTSAVFAAPFGRRVICVAHGFPRPDAQGWPTTLGVLASLKLANLSRHCRLVAVSDYVAAHLGGVYNLRVDDAIRNPVQSIFLEPWQQRDERKYLTYVGRLIPAKKVHRLLPAMCRLLDEDSRLHICIIGDGPQRRELEVAMQGETRVEFTGNLNSIEIRSRLRQTRVFVSGNEMEPFGITYLEALSQGCAVAMPACGGGLEIAPELIGSQIQLLPISFDIDQTLAAIRRANVNGGTAVSMAGYSSKDVAETYLKMAEMIGHEKRAS